MNKLGLGIGLVLLGLLFTQFVRSVSTQKEADGQDFARQVNLALRRTAHNLLRAQGDSTSRIAPVQQTSPHTFAIRLENSFEYDRIPELMQESLHQLRIDTPYDVAVLDCTNGKIQLGYTFYDLNSPDGIACSGRVQEAGCHTLQVTFQSPTEGSGSGDLWWAGALGFLLAGMGGLVWYRAARSRALVPAPETPQPNSGADLLPFGLTVLNAQDQTLTYRETKLLKLFAQHPNQLLEREYILKAVWEDEGIIVGRSVDVFVLRLRKLLQNDPTLRIASVHGVGYRLEVRSETA